MKKGINGITKAELYTEYQYTESGVDIYEFLTIGKEKVSVYAGSESVSQLSNEQKQNVYKMRNPYIVEPITEKVSSKKIDFKNADELRKKIENIGYEEKFERNFLGLIDDLT